MRILMLANNRVGRDITQWLQSQGEEIVGLVVHPAERSRYRDEIIQATGLAPEHIFEATHLQDPTTLEAVQALRPDLGISVFFGYILRQPFLNILPRGCINVHPALLPYNRGAYPNVWSIVEQTPAGATIHYIDEGVDTGDIIAQREVPVTAVDTGASLYGKLESACTELFQETWALIRTETVSRMPQTSAQGTMHRMRDVAHIDEIDLDRTYTARELINILRARTFPPYRGAYFYDGQRKIYLSIQLAPEEQDDQDARRVS
jgi:methionyl-tRNA formyltransferase